MKSILKKILPGLNNSAVKEFESMKERELIFENSTTYARSGNIGILQSSASGSTTSVTPFESTVSIPHGQAFFGSSGNMAQGMGIAQPRVPFNTIGMMPALSDFDQAKILLEYLQNKGVKYINTETAKALYVKTLYIGAEKEDVVKQPKKSLKF